MLPPPNPSGSGGSISSGSNSQNNNSSGNGLPPRRTPLSATSSLSTIYTSSNYTSSSSESVPTRSNPVAGPSRYTGDRHAARNIEGYGEAMKITGGCLSGKKVKFSLTMAQEPVHGRRRTEKDRRPLAHCPILRLKMKQMDMEGMEDEIDVGSFEPGCFVCAAELFEVDPSQPSSSSSRPSTSDIPQTVSSSSRSTSLSSTSTARQPSAVPHPLVMATRRPSTREMAQNTADVSIDNPPRPPPAPPHRAASWAADGPAGMAGMSAAARMRAEADFPLAPPRRPSIPSTPIATDSQTSSGSATPHPSSISPLNHDPSIARPVYTPDQHSESLRTSHLGHIEQNPRPGIQRTSGARSSGSSGDGDPTTAKPSSKRAKQTNEEDDDESGPSVDPSYHSSRRPGGMSAQRNLFGCLHVPAVRVIAPEGGLGLWFLFTDLTVRLEGTFALRFKVFDVTAADKTSKAPILVEAISQSFKVYSPRNFPGLPKPTELAEHFGRQGFKLNTRKNERQVKTPPPEPTPAAPTPTQTTQKQNPPQRPEARPVQSSPPESRIDNPPHFSSSSEHSDRRPETAGTQTTNNTATTTSFYSTDWDEGSMGTNTTSTSNLSGTGSKSKVAPSPLSRSFDEKM